MVRFGGTESEGRFRDFNFSSSVNIGNSDGQPEIPYSLFDENILANTGSENDISFGFTEVPELITENSEFSSPLFGENLSLGSASDGNNISFRLADNTKINISSDTQDDQSQVEQASEVQSGGSGFKIGDFIISILSALLGVDFNGNDNSGVNVNSQSARDESSPIIILDPSILGPANETNSLNNNSSEASETEVTGEQGSNASSVQNEVDGNDPDAEIPLEHTDRGVIARFEGRNMIFPAGTTRVTVAEFRAAVDRFDNPPPPPPAPVARRSARPPARQTASAPSRPAPDPTPPPPSPASAAAQIPQPASRPDSVAANDARHNPQSQTTRSNEDDRRREREERDSARAPGRSEDPPSRNIGNNRGGRRSNVTPSQPLTDQERHEILRSRV